MKQQLTLVATLTAKPQCTEELGQGLAALVAPTRQEEGSIDYHVHRDNNDPNVWLIYENWRSQADLDLHFEQPYTKAMLGRFPQLLARDMELRFLSMVSPRHPT
jgi:quinol monooxygenase YgiN